MKAVLEITPTNLRKKAEVQLAKLAIDGSLKISNSYQERKAFYRAAERLAMKISIRVMPDGVRLWRVK